MKCPSISKNTVLRGDSLEMLKCFPDNFASAIVTDPPYGLSINDDKWDAIGSSKDYQQWTESWAREANRVVKPGGYVIAFASPRLYHRLASGIEDAGFKVKDLVSWIHPKGFAMAMDAGMLIDKKACADKLEHDLGRKPTMAEFNASWATFRDKIGEKQKRRKIHAGNAGLLDKYKESDRKKITLDLAEPRTKMAKEWTGFKTGLKPLNEPIIIAQKETDGSIAENIKKWGVGAMNVDDARIPYRDDKDKAANTKGLKRFATQQGSKMIATRAGMSKDTIPLKGNLDGNEKGRFPANVIETDPILGDYDKFFLVSKPEVSEKTHDGLVKNEHPTVKPLNLMAHLVKLVTRPGDIVLDPFAGSGTTLVAAKCAGRNFVGMDIDPGSVGIAKKRIKASCEAK